MKRLWICAVCAVFGVACDDGGGDDAADSGAGGAGGGGGGSVAAATYNAGLARGFVDYADERVAQVMSGVAASGIDVFCGQEFWEEGDLEALRTATREALPHQYSIPADAGDPSECAACIPGETDALEACVRAQCAEVPDAMLIGCATMNCSDEVNGLSGGCVSCAATQVNKSIEEILAACVGDSEEGCYAYGGAFGTTINSRYPLADEDAKVFSSSLNRRAVLYARIPDSPVGELHVFCTHLSAIFSSIPYPKPEGSWEEEQATQIEEMRAFVDAKAGGGQVLLMGDFNTGPAIPNVAKAEAPDNYTALAAGYTEPFIAEGSPQCTFCADNPLVTGIDRSESELIDHILLKGFEGIQTASERFLDGRITIDSGGPIETAYSDHYGIRVTITR